MKFLLMTMVAFGLTSMAHAHQAPKHDHSKLVPIPAYNQPHGPASGAARPESGQRLFLRPSRMKKKQKFMFGLNARERSGWSNLPAGLVPRVGIFRWRFVRQATWPFV